MNSKRPKGVLIFGILEIIISSFTILLGIFAITFLPSLYGYSSFLDTFETSPFMAYSMGIIIIILSISISLFVSAIGILNSKDWGRKTILIASVISLAFGIITTSVSLLNIVELNYLLGTATLIPSIIYRGLVIWYFSKKETKDYFSKKDKSSKK